MHIFIKHRVIDRIRISFDGEAMSIINFHVGNDKIDTIEKLIICILQEQKVYYIKRYKHIQLHMTYFVSPEHSV